jgi:hypothetical protein
MDRAYGAVPLITPPSPTFGGEGFHPTPYPLIPVCQRMNA